ncbi:hypothetical protein V5799_000202 [Amblyomma americanum]|uniref:Uncharacterized protein n=1 Tax=Amblyomma americanum TaxID=6943 RepID=A0AAQ4D3Q8_AMBAM
MQKEAAQNHPRPRVITWAAVPPGPPKSADVSSFSSRELFAPPDVTVTLKPSSGPAHPPACPSDKLEDTGERPLPTGAPPPLLRLPHRPPAA